MDKVYLLLRSNRETGPYSLEEILQTGLQPNDLIWVEGKSCSWSNPSELEILKPYVAPTNKLTVSQPDEKSTVPPTPLSPASSTAATSSQKQKSSSKYVYVSLPSNFIQKPTSIQESSSPESLEQKAEELKKRIQAYSTENKTTEADTLAEPVYAHTLNDLEREYDAWRKAQKRTKKRRLVKKLVLTTLIPLLLGAGYVLAKDAIYTKKNKGEKQIVNSVNSSLKITKKAEPPLKEPPFISNESDFVEDSLLTNNEPAQKFTKHQAVPFKKKKNSLSKRQASTLKIAVPSFKDIEKEEKATMPPQAAPATESVTTNNTTLKEKKTLGKRISNLFKSKRKKQSEKEEKTPLSPPSKSD